VGNDFMKEEKQERAGAIMPSGTGASADSGRERGLKMWQGQTTNLIEKADAWGPQYRMTQVAGRNWMSRGQNSKTKRKLSYCAYFSLEKT